jgi:hypothetical protein
MWHRARSSRRSCHHGSDEQVNFPPLSCDCHPSAGCALPDLRPYCRVPAWQDQRGADRALPPGPSRNTQPLFPVVGRGEPTQSVAAPRAHRAGATSLWAGWELVSSEAASWSTANNRAPTRRSGRAGDRGQGQRPPARSGEYGRICRVLAGWHLRVRLARAGLPLRPVAAQSALPASSSWMTLRARSASWPGSVVHGSQDPAGHRQVGRADAPDAGGARGGPAGPAGKVPARRPAKTWLSCASSIPVLFPRLSSRGHLSNSFWLS